MWRQFDRRPSSAQKDVSRCAQPSNAKFGDRKDCRLRASHDLENVWVCKVVPKIRRTIFLAFRKSEKRGPAMQVFIDQMVRKLNK